MAEEIIQEEVLPVEEVSFEQPKPKTYLQKVHANLVDLYGKDQVPDEVTFSAKIKDPKYVKIVHDNLVHEYGQSEVPDIKSFTDSLIIVGPEKKNRGLDESKVSGVQSNPTELPLLSTKNNVQKVVTQTTDTFDKNANPTSLARQAYSLKQPKPVAKENVATDMMGMPVESSVDLYNENDINTSKNIDKHLEKLGYKKDFIDVVNRIPESYREATGYTDQELADLYKNDKNEFNKRTSEVLFREGLASGMNDIKSSIMKNTSLTPEEKDLQLGKIQNEEFLQNQEAMSTGGGFKNKQYFIGQTAKRIKQFIADPEKQKKALEDLATYAADDFGSLEDLEDKNKSPLSPNLNDYQSVALNYLEQIDPDKAAFYKKYVDIDKSKLKEFEYKGYQQILKELDEIGLNLVVNNAQNQIKPLADLAKQQEGKLDPSDYEVYNKLLETANLASTRLAKINQVYPDAKNLDTETIAGDLVGPRYSELEVLGNKLLYGLGKTGKGIYDIAATPFRTQQENDNAALEALGIENYVAPKTTPSSKNSLLARGEAKLSPELENQRQSIIKDKSLSQDEKVDKMIDLLERNPDKWTRPSEETSWNVGVNSITSSLLNFTADIAPFIALETLTAGGATSASASGVIKSFGKMFANVAVTSYSDELARQLKENNPNPELSAYSNILVNTIAYKLAGVGDIVKGIRGGAKELGGLTEKVISKLDDKAILDALKKPNPTLKSFFSDLGKTVVQSAGKGLKSGAAFETVIGSKEALMGEKVDSEFIKNRLVGLLNFTLFNVATRAPLGMPKIDKQSKEALFLAATNRDQVLYEAEKSFANKQISESEYNQIKNNVDAAYKVLERVPMVNGKGEELSRKEATELMYLKIQEQFIEDKMKKDLPKEVQEKITKELSDVQDKIDKVYKGTFIEDVGKPFAGLEDREAKRKIAKTEESKPTKFEVTKEVEPTEKEVFSETDKKGRISTYFSNTTESDGLTKTNFTFSRTDQNPTERFIATEGVPIEKALGDKYSVNEKDIPEGAKVLKVSEIRVDKEGNAAATVTFESNGETFKGEVKLNENEPTEAKVASDLVSVSVAPYYDTQIVDLSDASKLRESEGYKKHIQMLKDVAKTMGLEIDSIDNTIGGFENKDGNRITEISNRVKLKTNDLDVAERYAAVTGALAHEVQEATIAARYVKHGDKNQSAIEAEIKVSDLKSTVKALKEAGINDFEINENDNSVKILDFDNGKNEDFNNKMLSFADLLDKNNVKYETEHHAIESRYVDPERRSELLKEAKLQAERQEGGAELRDIYEKSKAKSEEFLGKKEVPTEIPEEVYTPIVNRIKKGIEKLSTTAKVSVLNGKNFAKALDEAIKNGKVNLQSWGGFEKKGFEESPQWQKLIEDGTVKLNFDIKGLEGKPVVVINPDNMLTGAVLTKNGKPIIDGNGGINFVTKFGDVWASSDNATANTLAKYINEARAKDIAAGGDGTVHVVVTKGDLSKSLTSHTGAKAAMKVLEYLVDKKYISLADFRKALTDVGRKYNIDLDGRLDAKSIHDDIAKKFFGVNDSTFSKRGFFVQDIIDHLAKNSKSAKDNISKIRTMLNTEALPQSTERKTGEISFAKEGIIDAIGHLLSDNMTVGVKNSEAYATIEIKHPVEVVNLNKEEGGHESYPFHLRQIDENGNKVKPVLNVLGKAQHVTDILNDANNQKVDKKGGAGKFGSNQIGMAKGFVKPASEHPTGVNMMTDATGKIYGFEQNGKIVLNADLMNGNTPFHEAGHLWLNWAKENRSDLHDAGMGKIENSKYLQDVKNNKVYQENASKLPEAEREAYFKAEALAKAIGDNGERFVNEAQKSDFKKWLKDLWETIATHFGLRDMTAEEISNLTLDDFSKKVAADIVGEQKGKKSVKVEIPVVEEPKPAKTPEEVAISKKALGDNYSFSKEFDVRGGDVVATDVLTTLNKKAKKNNVDLDVQIANEVSSMAKKGVEPTEFNIITAGSHLLNIDKKIDAAQTRGDLLEVENLNEQRKQVLEVLRTLGNKAGRNLGLFNLVFQDVDASEIKTTRNYLKKFLNVDDVPETVADLNKSNLTAEQKKTVKPYVEKIEKIKSQFDAVEKQVDKKIVEINNEEVNAAIEKARAEGRKEGLEEGLKSASTEVKQKKSKKIKDLASQIRRSDEFDKFLQGAGGLGDIKKAGVVDLGSYKEIVANVLDAVATAVELGENVTEAIKKAAQKFADVDQGKLISDVKTIISKASLPNKQEVMDKISEIAKANQVTGITKEMSDQGLIKDIVNSYLGSDLTNDKILDAATNDLKSILPNVTRESLSNAYVERGEFKKQTKAKIENEIDQKKADVKRIAIKEARLKALEAADEYHLEETKEGKKIIKSDYEKELDDKISALLKEKNNLEKEKKVSKAPKTEQDKIDEINKEISYVKQTKSVYEQAIQNPKKASDELIAARKERDETYAALGLKLEKNAKSPILVEREYQNAVKEIENSDLSKDEKNSKIEELTAQRDLDLQGTKQGVVSSLLDDINNLNSNSKNADLNNNLRSILNGLEPTGEKLDDQINKAYTKLGKLLQDESLTKEEIKSVSEIITNLENNNQLTSDELSAQRLKKQWENEIRKAETDIASGNFTKIPNNTYDYRRNDQLLVLNKARENKTGQYNRLVADAKEKQRTGAEKALDLSTKFLVSGIHTASKVLEAATFKPFMDSVVDLTAGRLASYITGAPYTSLYSVKKGYKTFAAFKNKEAAQKYIQKLQNDRDAALIKLQEANESGNQSDIKKADKEFKKADLEYAVSTLYNSIETNVLNSFWQYAKHGATDYDVNIGKSSKKDISEYRTILGKTGYVLDGWIRLHGAMKSSLSARPEMMKVFSSTLKDFQNKGKELSPENISIAMVLAADAYEAGRLTNKTALSKMISRGKGSEKSTLTRLITKGLMPVSTIAVNLAKRGIDYSTLGAEGFVRLATETKKGMKLNEVEGKTYDGIISRIKDGWNRMPLKERAYINGVIGRGLFGSAMAMATMYGLNSGMIKYGGTFEDQRKRKIMASDGEQLKAGEWEFFGERMPKAASLFLNHLPEFLTISLIADNYQINQMGGTGGEKFETTIDEIEARLPFQTIAGVFVPGRRVNTLVDRFTRIPIAAEAATLLDEKAEFRDKTDFINRIRGNIGLGFLNATKEQQKQIDEIKKSLRGLPEGVLTPEDEKDIDSVIREIKNIDFGELETKKAMEEMQKELKKQ
jgi:hypothetical protein